MPIEAFDFQFMIGDVKDYLEFSERNIDWQYRRELRAIEHRKDWNNFPSGYRENLEQNAMHRFKVSLPLRVRYGALIAFTTSVEWAVHYVNLNAVSPLSNPKDGINFTVSILRHFATQTAAVDTKALIDDYDALVKIRNCITHAAGIIETYKHKASLPDAIENINGIRLANWNFFGTQICIERGAIEPHIERVAALVVRLHSTMREQGLFKERVAPSLKRIVTE